MVEFSQLKTKRVLLPVLVVILGTGDLLLTWHLVSHGVGYEGNLLFAKMPLFGFAIVKVLATTGIAIMLLKWRDMALNYIACAIVGCVFAWNLLVLVGFLCV
jgi:hypothetical protein